LLVKEKFHYLDGIDYNNDKDYGEDDEGSTDSDSELEDEDGELITPQVDAQIMKTIAMIRAKNPEVYDEKTTFFSGTIRDCSNQHYHSNAMLW
jgi:protein KRI1